MHRPLVLPPLVLAPMLLFLRAHEAIATQNPADSDPRRSRQRLGHVVLGSCVFGRALDWYLDTLGMIVSDFLFLDGQRERGPVMAFIRCDLGSVPADHHTPAMHQRCRTAQLSAPRMLQTPALSRLRPDIKSSGTAARFPVCFSAAKR